MGEKASEHGTKLCCKERAKNTYSKLFIPFMNYAVQNQNPWSSLSFKRPCSFLDQCCSFAFEKNTGKES